jgi:carbonic anhydrase
MKRILAEVLLVLALGAAAFFGWTNWKSNTANGGQVAELTTQVEESGKKLKAAEEALAEALAETAKQIEPLKTKSLELDAVRTAMSSGETLKDLEAAYKKEKSLSPDRQVGLGAIRLLTKGSKDPATVEAFKKALESADWSGRKQVICAAQNALAAAGEKVNIMSECEGSGQPSDKGPAAKSGAHSSKAGDEKHAVNWGYEGAMGPESWGNDFPTCARGKAQAPLNIKGPFEKALFNVTPDYKNGPLKIINNGHTIQVNVPPGSKLRIDSQPFELVQFHFHRPSEEQINGKPSAMVAHFVHKNSEGRLAVLGVLLKEGNENPGIKTLWTHAPAKEGPEVSPEGVSFNPANLLPREYEFYSYEGSLTTPPCTEGVRFFILKSQVNISREQVEAFPFKKNARPVQPQNGRAIAG